MSAQRKNTVKPVKQPIKPEDIKAFIKVSDPQISPDGAQIVFTRCHIDEKLQKISNLWLIGTDKGESRQLSNGNKDGFARWRPDGQAIAFISGRNKPEQQIYLLSAQGGEALPLTQLPEGVIADLKWSPDGSTIAFRFRATHPDFTAEAQKKREETGASSAPMVIDTLWYRLDGDGYFLDQRFHLYVVDVASGRHRVLFQQGLLGCGDYDWSPDGKSLAVCANLDEQPMLRPWLERLYIVPVSGDGQVVQIPGQQDGSRSSCAWSPKGSSIAYIGRLGCDQAWGDLNQHLLVTDVASGKTVNLTEKTDYCMAASVLSDTGEVGGGNNIQWSNDGKEIFVNTGWHGNRHIGRVNVKSRTFEFCTQGNIQVTMGNLSAKNGLMALICGSDQELDEIYLGRVGKKSITPRLLSLFNRPWLESVELATAVPEWIKAADGTLVQMWVMKPCNWQATRKYPAVLQIHGGPHCLYGNAFFHEFQVLAARGYVVFFSNPRGSKGYGEAHTSAIHGDWGNKDWLDLQAVIAHIKGRRYVDTARMAVVGGSYGGYMTNWVIAHTDQFAAAVTDRCVSNMLSMMGSSDFVTPPDHYWDGCVWDRPEKLWQQSPIRLFGNVTTPTLVIHSEGDLRCNVEQGEQVFAALQVRGVPSRLVRYPRTTSHGMSRSGPTDLRIHRLHQILNWLDTWTNRNT